MATKTATATSQVRQCELLAQKLYAQCTIKFPSTQYIRSRADFTTGRDSNSAYKSLTSSIRSLRNLLGELDEILDIRLEPGAQDVKILYRIVDGLAVLQKLDIALVSFKCSSQVEVDLRTVAGFKTSVEGITHDLSKAHDAMTRSNETGSSVCGSSLKRSSQASSAWSVVHRDATGSDISSDGIEVHPPSDEKEVYLSRGVRSNSSLGLPTSWSSMFTDIDPLSMPLDDAAKMFFYDNEGEDDVSETGTDPIPDEVPEHDQLGDDQGVEEDTAGGAETETTDTPSPDASIPMRIAQDTIGADQTHLSPVELERLRQDSVISSPLIPKMKRPASGTLSPAGTDATNGNMTASPSSLLTPTIELTAPDNDDNPLESVHADHDAEQVLNLAPVPDDESETIDLENERSDHSGELRNSETLRTSADNETNVANRSRVAKSDHSGSIDSLSRDDTSHEQPDVAGEHGTEHHDTTKSGPESNIVKMEAETPVHSSDTRPADDAIEPSTRNEDFPSAPAEEASASAQAPEDPAISKVEIMDVSEPTSVPLKASGKDRDVDEVKPHQEDAMSTEQSPRDAVEGSKSLQPEPLMPRRAPPPPPPPRRSKPDLTHTTDGQREPSPPPLPPRHSKPVQTHTTDDPTLQRPTTPTPSEGTEDLYYATPPRKPALFEDFKLEPLQLAEVPPLEIRFTGEKNTSDVESELAPTVGGTLRRSGGLRNPRYCDYYASEEYYKSSAARRDKDLPPVPTDRELSKSSSCSDLTSPEEKPKDNETSSPRKSTGLLAPTRYLHARRKSAPSPVSAAIIPAEEQHPNSDHTLGAITEKSAALQSNPTSIWSPRKSADEALHGRDANSQRTSHKPEWESPDLVGVTEFYGPREVTPTSMLDQERIQLIVSFWNNRRWDEAALYLAGHLDSLTARSETSTAAFRRAKHLWAACSSFRGEWNSAIERFMEVLRRPVTNIFHLDDGDCAAAYWLGDLYAMQNRRADALLAYSIAERSTLFSDVDPMLQATISAEQSAVQLGVSKEDFKQRWDESKIGHHETDGILDPMIVSIQAAKQCLDSFPRRTQGAFYLSPNRTRASYLNGLQPLSKPHASLFENAAMQIDAEVFESTSPWPMPYDPLFCMANVQRSRLLAYECDMLAVFQSNPEAKLPRPLSLKKIDCFTCNDLPWLVQTIRTCLKTYEMGFSEVVNVQGVWWLCRYSFLQHRIATTHYFDISLFKHPFRSGIGVDICSETMSSARLVGSDLDYDNGVHASEPKRIKHLIREYLDEAWKTRSKTLKASSSV